ncbi:DUF4202 domain-containing protein [Arhodomonas sp. SL1]|uniref:DUF4202 domain-containing protein n=1 Tax=Arhodomonas sp. SL1 TaxID=3425691 RepID=UPI003F88594C
MASTRASPFEQALRALDDLHAEDPRAVRTAVGEQPQELWHAQRMSAWLDQVCEHPPSELLRLAVRGQHLQRWQLPRSEYPEGRTGYLRWRREQARSAGARAAAIALDAGYPATEAERLASLVRKEGLGRDPEAQAVEDCACLVFLEGYLAEFSGRVDTEHLHRILRRTWGKMSPRARGLAMEIPMAEEVRAQVTAALEGPSE